MHTDEYEISLSREISVCRTQIRKLRKALLKIEQAVGLSSGEMMRSSGSGGPGASEALRREWQGHHEALLRWEQRQREFEEIYRLMKE
jgi:hypothetical protein